MCLPCKHTAQLYNIYSVIWLTPEITEAQWFLGNQGTLKTDNIHKLHTFLFVTLDLVFISKASVEVNGLGSGQSYCKGEHSF